MCHLFMYVWFGSRLNMNHDSSQSNSIFCVSEGSVGITEVFVACDYPRAPVVILNSPWKDLILVAFTWLHLASKEEDQLIYLCTTFDSYKEYQPSWGIIVTYQIFHLFIPQEINIYTFSVCHSFEYDLFRQKGWARGCVSLHSVCLSHRRKAHTTCIWNNKIDVILSV